MSEDNNEIEKRLAMLSPLAQDALAARFLDTWAMVKHEHRPAASPASLPRSRMKSLSLGSALLGAIVGAAATFLAMVSFLSPKVEIREVVRERPARPATEMPARPDRDVVDSLSERARPKRNVEDQLAFADPSLRDIDALIAQREAVVRRMAVYESEVVSTDNNAVRPRISPEAYREYIRDLSVRP